MLHSEDDVILDIHVLVMVNCTCNIFWLIYMHIYMLESKLHHNSIIALITDIIIILSCTNL